MPLTRIGYLKNLIIAVLGGVSLLSVLGCQTTLPNVSSPEQTDTPSPTPTLQATPKPLSTAIDTISSNPQPTVITLTFWTVEQFSPQIDLVTQQLANFEAANPNVRVEVFQKKTTGQASILNYLKSAKEVAPGVLPDIVILNTDQLAQAWRTDLIQPLDGKLDRTIIQDLLPAAQKLGVVDDQLAGIPFEIDVEHLVYNTSQITSTPILWTDVLSSGTNYQFPAKGQNGLLNDASIIQYLSAGGELTNDEGMPAIDEAALRAMLNYYRTTLDKGIINQQILEFGQTEETWEQYLNGSVGMTHIDAHIYLDDRRSLNDSQAAAIPTQNGNLTTIGHGRAFALVTKDPSRQNYALKLIETFMEPEINAAWATRSAVIPTRRTAFDLVANDDPYWVFLDNYLQTTISPPSFADYDRLSRILQQAVFQVLNGEATPDEAVETAVNALNQ
jgi:multiple sugar transport system substrate-binding protein